MKNHRHQSLAEISEGPLIQRLLGHCYGRELLLGIEGIPSDGLAVPSVPLAGLPGGPKGDIDILVCHKARPDEATAIQVKRIKVGASAFETGLDQCVGFARLDLVQPMDDEPIVGEGFNKLRLITPVTKVTQSHALTASRSMSSRPEMPLEVPCRAGTLGVILGCTGPEPLTEASESLRQLGRSKPPLP